MRPFGSRALITGGSRGIGLSYAEALAHAGCDLVLVHHEDREAADAQCARLAVETGRTITALEADVGSPIAAREAVDLAANRMGGLDIVVSNAGICRFLPFLELDDDTWSRHAAVNLHGGFYIGQQAARHMARQGRGGRIVFTTSVGASRSNGTQTHYCATKGGLRVLAQGMAIELGPYGITVNCIAPGWIHTGINDAASRDEAVTGPWLNANCAAGRLGRPEDLKAALLFLTSVEAAYVTGSTITVDGGWDARL